MKAPTRSSRCFSYSFYCLIHLENNYFFLQIQSIARWGKKSPSSMANSVWVAGDVIIFAFFVHCIFANQPNTSWEPFGFILIIPYVPDTISSRLLKQPRGTTDKKNGLTMAAKQTQRCPVSAHFTFAKYRLIIRHGILISL